MSMNMTMDWHDTCCMIKVEFFLVESALGPGALGWNPSLKYRGGGGVLGREKREDARPSEFFAQTLVGDA